MALVHDNDLTQFVGLGDDTVSGDLSYTPLSQCFCVCSH